MKYAAALTALASLASSPVLAHTGDHAPVAVDLTTATAHLLGHPDHFAFVVGGLGLAAVIVGGVLRARSRARTKS